MKLTTTTIPTGLALFALGFRPFFLGAGLVAALLMLAWLFVLEGQTAITAYYGFFLWHGHEMIFGYSIAVMAGFLLTAVRNWTGRETTSPALLMALFGLWSAGRILPLFAGLLSTELLSNELWPFEYWRLVIAVTDLLFIPALVLTLSVPLIKSKNTRNLFFIPLFLVLFSCNLIIHLEVNGLLPEQMVFDARLAERLAIGLVLVAIVVIGGRVIPMFSRSGLAAYTCHIPAWLDTASIMSMLFFVLSYVFAELFGLSILVVISAAIAAMFNAARLVYWYDKRIWQNAMVWVLHTAYLWLVIGLSLFVVQGFFFSAAKPAMHAMTVGAIGGMTLGMMVRVSLGHTGRPIEANKAIVVAFLMLNLTALLRVFAPMIDIELYRPTMMFSGFLWSLSFIIFLVHCGPLLSSPRPDGRPG